MTKSMRPGIYTDYTVTPIFSGNRGRAIGIIAKTTAACTGVQAINSLSQAKRIFGEAGEQNVMMQMITAIYIHTSPMVYAVGVQQATQAEYESAIDILMESNAYIVTLDCKDISIYQYLQAKLGAKEEKIGIVTGILDKDSIELANTLNSERICLAIPAVKLSNFTCDLSGVAMACLISMCEKTSTNLNGQAIHEAMIATENFTQSETEEYLKNGICVFEQRGGIATLIRGMTTRTKNDSDDFDTTYRNIGVILVIDTVIPALRNILRTKLGFIQNNKTGLNSILSLVVCQLDEFVDQGILSSYQMPRIFLDSEDTSVCIVEVAFTVALGINSIYLTAHISV